MAAPPKTCKLMVHGDSLSAAYGLKREEGWVTLLEKKLSAEKIDCAVVNASISGETTAGGLARLPALLAQHKPSHVLLELGGNDGLRGLPLNEMNGNLLNMVTPRSQGGPTENDPSPNGSDSKESGQDGDPGKKSAAAAAAAADAANFEKMEKEIKEALAKNPKLDKLKDQVQFARDKDRDKVARRGNHNHAKNAGKQEEPILALPVFVFLNMLC